MPNNTRLTSIISDASFDHQEAKILCSLYEIGIASVYSLSKKVGLARPSIYSGIRKLTRRNLVNSKKNGRRTLYRLSENFDFRIIYSSAYKQVSKIITQPLMISNKISAVDFDTLNDFLDEALKLKRGEIIYSIETPEDIKYLLNTAQKAWVEHWQKTVARKGIVLKGVSSPEGLSVFKKNIGNLSRIISKRSGSARFLDDINIRASIVSFGSYLCFFERQNNKFVIITDTAIAKTAQSLIDIIYTISENRDLF